jgi:hypothetical protein
LCRVDLRSLTLKVGVCLANGDFGESDVALGTSDAGRAFNVSILMAVIDCFVVNLGTQVIARFFREQPS